MPHRAPLPNAPQPTRTFFDPFNSSATGHQRADNRLSGSTSWRDSRSYKLSHQFRDATGGGGDAHLSDLVGAGSENFGVDGRKENGDWEVGAPGLREDGWQDVRHLLRVSKAEDLKEEGAQDHDSLAEGNQARVRISTATTTATSRAGEATKKRIFYGLIIYINGSTAPLVGDHKLKHLLAQHGANVSIALGRRTVTHVILGESKEASGSAKGLAASKIQKEIARVGGKGVKYVSVRWVLESIKAGKRLPEAQFSALNLNHKGSKGVYGMLLKQNSSESSVETASKDTNLSKSGDGT